MSAGEFPEAPLAERQARAMLVGHRLDVGDAIEVELLVARSDGGPRLVEGTVLDATPMALVIETRSGGRRTARIPWQAISLIRDALTDHPGR